MEDKEAIIEEVIAICKANKKNDYDRSITKD